MRVNTILELTDDNRAAMLTKSEFEKDFWCSTNLYVITNIQDNWFVIEPLNPSDIEGANALIEEDIREYFIDRGTRDANSIPIPASIFDEAAADIGSDSTEYDTFVNLDDELPF